MTSSAFQRVRNDKKSIFILELSLLQAHGFAMFDSVLPV